MQKEMTTSPLQRLANSMFALALEVSEVSGQGKTSSDLVIAQARYRSLLEDYRQFDRGGFAEYREGLAQIVQGRALPAERSEYAARSETTTHSNLAASNASHCSLTLSRQRMAKLAGSSVPSQEHAYSTRLKLICAGVEHEINRNQRLVDEAQQIMLRLQNVTNAIWDATPKHRGRALNSSDTI